MGTPYSYPIYHNPRYGSSGLYPPNGALIPGQQGLMQPQYPMTGYAQYPYQGSWGQAPQGWSPYAASSYRYGAGYPQGPNTGWPAYAGGHGYGASQYPLGSSWGFHG